MGENDNKLESAKTSNKADNEHGNGTSDFFVGLVTFVVFIIFMSAWMYFSV